MSIGRCSSLRVKGGKEIALSRRKEDGDALVLSRRREDGAGDALDDPQRSIEKSGMALFKDKLRGWQVASDVLMRQK